MVGHSIKITQVFLPRHGQASWSLLRSSVSFLSEKHGQPENNYSGQV